MWVISERDVGALAEHSRDHSNHRAWLNDLTGALRRIAPCRERAVWIDGGNAMADEQGVVSEYHDSAYREEGWRAEFKSVAFLDRRQHA
jgi:hypothetical protein